MVSASEVVGSSVHRGSSPAAIRLQPRPPRKTWQDQDGWAMRSSLPSELGNLTIDPTLATDVCIARDKRIKTRLVISNKEIWTCASIILPLPPKYHSGRNRHSDVAIGNYLARPRKTSYLFAPRMAQASDDSGNASGDARQGQGRKEKSSMRCNARRLKA